eukprot:TRINITY_DN7580_c0_g1_i1.p1 TRINITY_DN7580_c0_g1~~TRINITY_DN7580_c0_g1_i1.p1  ORF type:complete len:280 (+),score=39.45 TRINITY_DN7580_c0_g1_i1:45-884(+)
MRARTTVSYRSVHGVDFRYTAGETGLIEQTLQDGKWKSQGSHTTLWWYSEGPTLKQSNTSYVLPEGEETDLFQEQLLLLCKKCSSRVVFEYSSDCDNKGQVIVGAPSGDYILFKSRKGFVEERLLTADGWKTVGKATRLTYSPKCRGIVDQNGAGGVLPVASLNELLASLRHIADQSGIPHDNLVPNYYPTHHTQFQTVRRKSSLPQRISRPKRSTQPPPFLKASRSISTGSGASSSIDDVLSDIQSQRVPTPTENTVGSVNYRRRSTEKIFFDYEIPV